MKSTILLLGFLLCPAGAVLRGTSASYLKASASVHVMIKNLMSGKGDVRYSHVIDEVAKHTDFGKASAALREKHALPRELSLLLTGSSTKNSQSLDEDSMTKARNFLNGLVEAAYRELDTKIIEVKEFEDRNRGSWDQVVADMSRLGAQVADHIRMSSEATSCIASIDQQVDSVREQLQMSHMSYVSQHAAAYQEVQIKQNDLKVFDFLIQTTKTLCDELAGFVQVPSDRGLDMQVCDSENGAALRFHNPSIQAKFDRMLDKGSRDLLKNALMKIQTGVSLVQKTESHNHHHRHHQPKVPVTSGQSDSIGDLKCGPIPDCGLLYDTLSIEWGGYKDQVDELTKGMADDAAAWKELKMGFDAQIDSLTTGQAECVGQLAEATAKKNADSQELDEKKLQKRELNQEHTKTMKEFRARIKYIFNQDICGPIVVRNEITKTSATCAPKMIDDCDVTAWTPEACSVDCDDGCPDSIGCGGRQRLTREAVVTPNDCGIKCPAFTLTMKCNQIKCPSDCLMSKWSGFSKCSKDCDGGVEQRTRSIITKSKNGGRGCSAVSDARPCNTGSCDRDCTLQEWTSWSACSMACNTGNQERYRRVDIPIRGDGRCPKERSSYRLQRQDCNANECIGDEICIARQDVIINVDGSGSVNAASWLLVKNFTGELLKRYKSQYYGNAAAQLGIVLFGNGKIEEDGTISKAVLVSELVADMAALKTAAAAMAHKAGFSNMAQGFVLAEKLLQQKGRKDAQFAILTISDGKPSFLFETTEKARELDDKGIMKYMVSIAEFPGSDEWRLMQEMASKPADTNTVRVPGFDALEDGGGPFVRDAIAKFCPAAMSPSQTLDQGKTQGWMLVYERGYCGNLGRTLSRDISDPDACRQLASDVGATAFSMGRRYRRGRCSVETLGTTCDNYKAWQAAPENPTCATSFSGGFHKSRYYDWYAIEPTGCE